MNQYYAYSNWLLPLIISAVLLLVLLVYAYRRRDQALARTFIALIASILLWTSAYTLGLAATDLALKIFWMRIKYLGSASAPVIWLLFSLQFTQHDQKIIKRIRILLCTAFAVTLGVVFTSSWQTWMWKSVWIQPGLIEEQVTHGWYFWVYVAGSYISILISAWLYGRFLWKVPAMHRKQSLLMTFGGITPLLARIAFDFFGLDFIPQLDEVILFFLISSVLFSIALFRYNTLSIMPVAYARIFESMQIGIIILDPKMLAIELNPAAKRIIGIDTARYQGLHIHSLWEQSGEISIETDSVVEIENKKNDAAFYYRIQIDRINGRLNRPAGYILLITDITQQKIDAMELEIMARVDGLTGLLNRRTFMELAEKEFKRSMRYGFSFAVLLIDIDHFKQVNDAYGHQAGDFVLKEVADRLKTNYRSMDLFGRYGGEEFIVLLPHIAPGDEAVIAETTRKCVCDKPVSSPLIEQPVPVTISVGAVLFTPAQNDGVFSLDAVISRADKMLYESKHSGRNAVSAWPSHAAQ